MNMKFGVFALATLPLLAACGGEIETRVHCSGGSSSSTYCDGDVTYTVALRPAEGVSKQAPGIYGTASINAGQLVYDLSSSTGSVMSNSGTAIIVAELASGGSVSQSFQWVRQGQTLVAQDPSAVNAWAASLDGLATGFELSYGTFLVSNSSGSNTVTAELKYQGSVVSGDASGWYNDPCSSPYFYCEIQ